MDLNKKTLVVTIEIYDYNKTMRIFWRILIKFISYPQRILTNLIVNFLSKKSLVNVSYPTFSFDRIARAIEPGDILLVEGVERYSTVIKYFTQSIWSHAALYIGEGKLIEVDFKRGVIEIDLSYYRKHNTRICRPIGLNSEEVSRLIQYAKSNLGHTYDLQNIFDLARYLFPMPPVPNRWKRKVFEFGSGQATKVICSSMIASAFQSIGYPIFPIQLRKNKKRFFKKRPATQYTPADFERSPYFVVINPNSLGQFNFRSIKWFNPTLEDKQELAESIDSDDKRDDKQEQLG